ncbi:MAG: hypothetical protein WAT66_11870 [Actinomycetota bacterium]
MIDASKPDERVADDAAVGGGFDPQDLERVLMHPNVPVTKALGVSMILTAVAVSSDRVSLDRVCSPFRAKTPQTD